MRIKLVIASIVMSLMIASCTVTGTAFASSACLKTSTTYIATGKAGVILTFHATWCYNGTKVKSFRVSAALSNVGSGISDVKGPTAGGTMSVDKSLVNVSAGTSYSYCQEVVICGGTQIDIYGTLNANGTANLHSTDGGG